MKREFLKELGLTDEQIDKIMAENGKDIEKAKGDIAKLENDLSTKETEIETIKGQLNEANAQIESFKEMDIEGIKKAADDYKAKSEQAEIDAQAKIEELQFSHALDKALSGAKAKNSKAVKALLDLEGLKFNKDEIVGLNEQLERIKEENDYLFESKEGVPTIVRPGSGGDNPKDSSKLTYSEMMKMAEKNPNIKFD